MLWKHQKLRKKNQRAHEVEAEKCRKKRYRKDQVGAHQRKKRCARAGENLNPEVAPVHESINAFATFERDVSDQILSDNAAAQILNQMTRNVDDDDNEPLADLADHVHGTTQDARLSDELVTNSIGETSLNAEHDSIFPQPSVNFEQGQSQKEFTDFNLDDMITDTCSAPAVSPIFFGGEYIDFDIDDMLRQLPRAESEFGSVI